MLPASMPLTGDDAEKGKLGMGFFMDYSPLSPKTPGWVFWPVRPHKVSNKVTNNPKSRPLRHSCYLKSSISLESAYATLPRYGGLLVKSLLSMGVRL